LVHNGNIVVKKRLSRMQESVGVHVLISELENGKSALTFARDLDIIRLLCQA